MRPLGLPRWAPHPMTGVRLRKRKEDRHREGGHVKMEAEVNPMQPQAKEHLESPEAGQGKAGFSPKGFREVQLSRPQEL